MVIVQKIDYRKRDSRKVFFSLYLIPFFIVLLFVLLIIFKNSDNQKKQIITGNAASTIVPISWLIIVTFVLAIAIIIVLIIFLFRKKDVGKKYDAYPTSGPTPVNSRTRVYNYPQQQAPPQILRQEQSVTRKEPVQEIQEVETNKTQIEDTSKPLAESTVMVYPRKEPVEIKEEDQEPGPEEEIEVEDVKVEPGPEEEGVKVVEKPVKKVVVKKPLRKPIRDTIKKTIKKTIIKSVKKKVVKPKKETEKADIIIPVEDEREEKIKNKKSSDDAEDMFKDISEINHDDKVVVEKDEPKKIKIKK